MMIYRFIIAFFLLLPTTTWAGSLPKADLVFVNKSERKLYLINEGQIYREYPISLSKDPFGHKMHQGDKRTPEGRYVLDWRNSKSRFHKSIHISYPNKKDIHRAQANGLDPGGMIMIHGLPNRFKGPEWLFDGMDWTDGCIALNNADVDEIWACVENGTPIEITP